MRILMVFLFLCFLVGCAQKPSNEISEMALECMKNHSGITITFTPQPETKVAQETK